VIVHVIGHLRIKLLEFLNMTSSFPFFLTVILLTTHASPFGALSSSFLILPTLVEYITLLTKDPVAKPLGASNFCGVYPRLPIKEIEIGAFVPDPSSEAV
jgi:hypothetical protein